MNNNIRALASDRLSASERFRRTVTALSQRRSEAVMALYSQAPILTWNGPDPAFQERVRHCETLTRNVVADLNQLWVRLTLLTSFEDVFKSYDAVVRDGLNSAFCLGWQRAQGIDAGEPGPSQDLEVLQDACRPEPITPAIDAIRQTLASYWHAWSDFTRATWRLRPEVPVLAWFDSESGRELLEALRTNPAKPDTAQAAGYRAYYDAAWETTLTAIAASGLEG